MDYKLVQELNPFSGWGAFFVFWFIMFVSFLIGFVLANWKYRKSYSKELKIIRAVNRRLQTRLNEIIPLVPQSNKKKTVLDFEGFEPAELGEQDDLKKISGVGPYIEEQLNNIGVYTYHQLEGITDNDIDTITALIEYFPGRIKRENWKKQARDLQRARD